MFHCYYQQRSISAGIYWVQLNQGDTQRIKIVKQ